MPDEDSPADSAGEGAVEASNAGTADDADVGPESERTGRPLIAGAIGLLAGIVGGIAGTTIAPDDLYVTVVLVAGVALLVTLGTLRLLQR